MCGNLRFYCASLLFLATWMAATAPGAGGSRVDTQLDTNLSISLSAFARLARSQEFYRSTRPATMLARQEVVELGEWVPWEFQSEDEEAPSNSESPEEVVPSPPPVSAGSASPSEGKDGVFDGGQAQSASTGATQAGKNSQGEEGECQEQGKQEEPRQMYRKVRLRSAVTTPLGSTHNNAVQGQTLREGQAQVTYTETDCVSGLPLFLNDLAVKTTFRVTRSEKDPESSVRVQVTIAVRDVKLPRGMGWVSKLVKRSITDSGRKQARKTLNAMVKADS